MATSILHLLCELHVIDSPVRVAEEVTSHARRVEADLIPNLRLAKPVGLEVVKGDIRTVVQGGTAGDELYDLDGRVHSVLDEGEDGFGDLHLGQAESTVAAGLVEHGHQDLRESVDVGRLCEVVADADVDAGKGESVERCYRDCTTVCRPFRSRSSLIPFKSTA